MKSSHVRMDMMFAGETKEAFNSEKIHFVIKGTADLALVDMTSVEVDTIKTVSQRRAQSVKMVSKMYRKAISASF